MSESVRVSIKRSAAEKPFRPVTIDTQPRTATRPSFLYFDLGNVLFHFDREIAFRKMARVAGITPDRVGQIIYDSGLQRRYESGEVSSQEFYEAFCREAHTRPDYDALAHASSEMFQLNHRVVPIVTQLAAANYPLGILSNTCQTHWEHVSSGQYSILPAAFTVEVLSYRVGAMKPDARIYHAAAQLAGVVPQEIFFTDDLAVNVAAARQFGFDAVQYTGPADLARALRVRGVRFNC